MESSNEFTNSSLPKSGRLAGIDFGTVRVGISICDPHQSIASPLETYQRRSEAQDGEFFTKLVAEYSVVGFVVGLPLHMSGDESQKSQEARTFGNWLTALTGLSIAWVDERYSTRFAKDMLEGSQLSAKKRKARLDKLAAQAILTAYLENPEASSGGAIE